MKIRLGFVSNSSSSSFVLIGAILNDGDYDENELYRKLIEYKGLEFPESGEADDIFDIICNKLGNVIRFDDNGTYIGEIIVGKEDACGFDGASFDIQALVNKVHALFDALGIDKKIEIHVGTIQV